MTAINSLTYASERLKINTNLSLERMRRDLLSISNLSTQEVVTAEDQSASFDQFSKKLFAFVKESQQVSQQQIILQTLLFDEIQQREEIIKDAHKETLDWIFKEEESKFMDWLKNQKGIYWVRGKVRDPPLKTLTIILPFKEICKLRSVGWERKVYSHEIYMQSYDHF